VELLAQAAAAAQTEGLFSATNLNHMAMAAIYSVLGIVIFAVGFLVVDKLTPGSLWKEIMEEKNSAVAILFGCWAIAMGIIIAAAIHSG
jgi:uncharacterized membrane protein YjfL (UPF0719 family)